ncbi:transcriptional regulator [Alistipes senegalensis]|uniref:transcriptional regulator n=1 Tax=Alistipes senegalensis TaxID=1288121 RepID=UPI001E5A2F6D|nr:transcriptional regulator [Alistipes senegalensis]
MPVQARTIDGRNKPGFDLLQKILRRFPQINPDWLLLDSPQMYRDEHPGISQASAPASASQLPIDNDLFGSVETKVVSPKTDRQEPEVAGSSAQSAASQFPVSRTGASVQRVVLFYDDQTFESFEPTKR